MSLEDSSLPSPPRIIGGEIELPNYFPCNHPYTKWMLNMLRCGASFRISTMIKERPELFQQIYQVPDWPDLITNQPNDKISMFNRHTILLLNPLCLAIYMKKDKSADLILKSGLNSCNEKCWAIEVYSRIQSGAGDILEILPICIAIRREYFDAIPILTRVNCKELDYLPRLDINEKILLRYETKDMRKLFRYRDSLQYAIDTLKKRGNLHVSRMLEMFILERLESFDNSQLDDERSGNSISLFNRIIRTAFYDDPDCRVSMQLIQCLEVLLKHKCVPWNISMELNASLDNSQNLIMNIAKDFCNCLTFLLALYNKIQMRVKNGPLDNLGYLIIKTLQHVQWRDNFFQMTPEQIQMQFGKLDNILLIPIEAIEIIKKHIKAITDLEKERELKISFPKPRLNGYPRKSKPNNEPSEVIERHRRSCSLKEKVKYPETLSLLQIRKSNCANFINNITNSNNPSNSSLNSLKRSLEFSRIEESTPLFTYQTGTNSNTTNCNNISNQMSSNPPDHKLSDQIESYASKSLVNTINKSLQSENNNVETNNNDDNKCYDSSCSTSEINCLEMSPIRELNACHQLNPIQRICSRGDIRLPSNVYSNYLGSETYSDNDNNFRPTKPSNVYSQSRLKDDDDLFVFTANSDTDNENIYDNNNNDLSDDFTNDFRLLELEDKLFDELYMEYVNRKRHKLKKSTVRIVSSSPLIRRRHSKLVNNDNIS